jgi:hypothetical protein
MAAGTWAFGCEAAVWSRAQCHHLLAAISAGEVDLGVASSCFPAVITSPDVPLKIKIRPAC